MPVASVWGPGTAPDELAKVIGPDALELQRRANRAQAAWMPFFWAAVASVAVAAGLGLVVVWVLAACFGVFALVLFVRWSRLNRRTGEEASKFVSQRIGIAVTLRGGRRSVGNWRAAIDLARERAQTRAAGKRPPFFAVRVGVSPRYRQALDYEDRDDAPR